MNLSQTVRKLCKDTNTPLSELARRTNQSPQNLHRKLAGETLNFEEFQQMLDVLGVQFEYSFRMPEGETVGLLSENERAREKTELLEAQVNLAQKNINFLNGICRDIRTAGNTVSAACEIAVKHTSDRERVAKCLQKIAAADRQITLLLDEAEKMQKITADLQPDTPSVPEISLAGKRVLIAESDPVTRAEIRDILEDNAIITDEAEDGLKAVNAVHDNGTDYYQYILLATQMNVVNGYEAVRSVRKLKGAEKLAVIALGSESERQKVLNAGMNALIVKPVSAEKLLDMLKKLQ